jgi:hypothetical protein
MSIRQSITEGELRLPATPCKACVLCDRPLAKFRIDQSKISWLFRVVTQTFDVLHLHHGNSKFGWMPTEASVTDLKLLNQIYVEIMRNPAIKLSISYVLSYIPRRKIDDYFTATVVVVVLEVISHY